MPTDAQKRQRRVRALRAKAFEGKLPALESLEAAGLDWASFNDMRREAGLSPVAHPDKVRSRPVRDSDKDFTLDQLTTSLLALVGTPLLTDDGQPKRTPEGRVRTLSAITVNSWIQLVRMIVAAVGDPKRVMASLRDSDRVVAFLKTRSHTPASLATRLYYLAGLQRYVPEYRRLLGPAALEAYRDSAALQRDEAREDGIGKTEDPDHAVPAFPRLLAAVPLVAETFGVHSMEHLAARLHTEVVGLRDDLKAVPVFDDAASVPDGTENHYAVDSGRLVISVFKTSYMFPPYDVRLRPDTAALVRASLRKKPRKYLLGKGSNSPLVRRAFQAVGLEDARNVMDVRHSMLTHLLDGNAGLAHVRRVARRFKHDVKTALGYVRVTNDARATSGDGDGDGGGDVGGPGGAPRGGRGPGGPGGPGGSPGGAPRSGDGPGGGPGGPGGAPRTSARTKR